jgi:hypothetical protein
MLQVVGFVISRLASSWSCKTTVQFDAVHILQKRPQPCFRGIIPGDLRHAAYDELRNGITQHHWRMNQTIIMISFLFFNDVRRACFRVAGTVLSGDLH